MADGDRSPTAPGRAVIRLTVTPAGGGALIQGDTVPIVMAGGPPSDGVPVGAFAEYSDGTGEFVAASWRSENEDIIAVVGATLVARGRGMTILTATFDRWTDSETFLVEGGIPGRWTGSYVIEQCAASSGSMAEVVCGAPRRPPGLAPVGALLPIDMHISEMGEGLIADLSLGPLRGRVSGQNRGHGFFTVLGGAENGPIRIHFFHWDALVQRDEMFGFIGYEVRIGGLPGLAQVAAKLTNVTRQ